MIKVIDRYLLRYFIITLLVIAFAFGLLIVAINMIEELRRFIDNDVPIDQVFMYYLYFAGWVIKSFLPVFVLLAALVSIGILARRNEILAMKSGGISLYRIAAPILVFSLFLSVAHMYYNEKVFPEPNKKRVEMKEYVIRNKSRGSRHSSHNIYRQVNKNLFYVITSYNIPRMEGEDVKIYKSEDNRLSEIITADKIRFTSQNWMLYDGVKREFSDSGEVFMNFDSISASYIDDRPSDFERPLGKPEDMGYDELKHYIDLMKRTGGPFQRELVDLKLKLSYPFASVIVILICVPIAANPRRGGIAVSFSVGAGIALTYFVSFKIVQSFGYSGRLEPDIAAWLVNAAFLVVGIIIISIARK